LAVENLGISSSHVIRQILGHFWRRVRRRRDWRVGKPGAARGARWRRVWSKVAPGWSRLRERVGNERCEQEWTNEGRWGKTGKSGNVVACQNLTWKSSTSYISARREYNSSWESNNFTECR
jgi:hypothetical protein